MTVIGKLAVCFMFIELFVLVVLVAVIVIALRPPRK